MPLYYYWIKRSEIKGGGNSRTPSTLLTVDWRPLNIIKIKWVVCLKTALNASISTDNNEQFRVCQYGKARSVSSLSVIIQLLSYWMNLSLMQKFSFDILLGWFSCRKRLKFLLVAYCTDELIGKSTDDGYYISAAVDHTVRT